jgi:cytochrome c551/c552
MGHPASLVWSGMPGSPVTLKQDQVFALVKPRNDVDEAGKPVKPENIVNEKFVSEYELKKAIPELQLPAVWLPHGILGISNSEIVKIPEGTWGPFSGQLLVGDQGMSKISRVFMEKIGGEYQGAAIEFRSGFQSGIVRMAWAKDGSLFAGETARGWGSAGEAAQGLQRLVWNGKIPFEMRAVRAMPDGFEIEFTKPADRKYAEDIASYNVESFIYKYHSVYGSPPVNNQKLAIKGIKLSADALKARIVVDGLRPYYIHTITLNGVRDAENAFSLVHPTAYYTLNRIPEGARLTMAELSTKNSAATAGKNSTGKSTPKTATSKEPAAAKPVAKNPASATAKAPTYADVKPLLLKNTCTACHNPDKRQVGPAFKDVAKRKYSVEKIVQLIHNPKPQNWPDYATPMPPMPQVPAAEARKIAQWINTLK